MTQHLDWGVLGWKRTDVTICVFHNSAHSQFNWRVEEKDTVGLGRICAEDKMTMYRAEGKDDMIRFERYFRFRGWAPIWRRY
jgi:hypothetical protein